MPVKILYVFIVLNCTVFSVSGRKHNSSVAFVVDRTSSMQKVIDYVKQEIHKVFDAVFSSNSGTIDDFILVAFDDPRVKKNGKDGAQLLCRTSDKDVFKAAIDDIKLMNGGDCPEYSMTGIEKALEYCKSQSFIYVFTDAAPADYDKLESVKTTSQEKNVQVNFLLTGMCKKDVRKQLTAFENITQATSGQIFNIVEEETSKIIKYIIQSIKDKRTVLINKHFHQKEKEITFTVDSKIADVMISVSSPTPTYQLIDADGNSIATKEVVHTDNSTIDKMETKPGNYFIRLNNLNESVKHSVVVTGVTTVSFQYGFSLNEPTTFNDTKPQPFNNTADHQYLSIELENEDKDVLLETAELRDLDDKVLRSLSLKIINEEQQLYVTEPFLPPFDGSVVMFKIAIIGFTKSRERITRVSTTSSQYVPPYIPPKVILSPEGPVVVNFEASLTLTCRVQGSTKLTVEWTDEAGAILPSEPMILVETPHKYNSVLKINKLRKNITVTCTAKSGNGDKDAKSIEIKTKGTFLIIVTRPSDKSIVDGNSAVFKCIVDASPIAKIEWYKDNKKMSNDRNFKISIDKSILTLRKMSNKLKGSYHVTVSNGYADETIEFKVYSICKDASLLHKPNMERLYFKVGERMTIKCTEDDCPKRSVTWLHNNMEISSSNKYEFLSDNSLRLNSLTNDDHGKYTCKVIYIKNKVIEYDYAITIYEPLFIEPPKERRVVTTVGSSLTLVCNVHGLPKPFVTWQYERPGTVKTPLTKSVLTNASKYTLKVKLKDEGTYTCKAKRSEPRDKTATISYEVYVRGRPVILFKSYERAQTTGIVGDLVYIIDCKVEGRPPPKITWYRNGLDISRDTELYTIEENILYIKNLTLSSKGSYICDASNEMGYASHSFYVDVSSKITDVPTEMRTETIPIGSSKEITCQINGVYVRWYKNGVFLNEGRLIFTGASARDSGVYTCRASDLMTEPLNDVVNIIVGRKPEFVSNEYKIIKFQNGVSKILDCTVRAKPEPKITWTLDSTILKEKSMLYNLTMTNINIGTYKCVVENVLGNVTREFYIKSEACPVPEANKLGRHLPLIISSTDTILTKKTLKYYESITIYCPETFLLHDEERLQFEKVSATCINQSLFKINGKDYNIAKLKCEGEIKATYRTEGKRCNRGNATELVQVGFTFNSKFRSIFDTCIDKDNNRVHFTKYDMHPGIAKSHDVNALPSAVVFDKSDIIHLNFDAAYDCQKQLRSIYDLTGKRLSKDDKCCFAKRQLVPPLDVPLGLPQAATFCDVNVAPVWSSCRFENWNEVERRVRTLVQNEDRIFEVWTGSSHPMLVKTKTFQSVELRLNDGNDHQQVVPTYIWKLVIDRKEEQSLAIVLINLPNVKLEQIPPYTICDDVCSKTVWMNNSEWQNVEKGFVFCCSIRQFEEAFDFKNMFKIKSQVLV